MTRGFFQGRRKEARKEGARKGLDTLKYNALNVYRTGTHGIPTVMLPNYAQQQQQQQQQHHQHQQQHQQQQ